MKPAALIKRLTGRTGDNIFDLILRGGVVSLSVRVTGLFVGLLAHFLLARALGVSQYGFYAVALSWCMILAVPVKFGLDHTALRYASKYFETSDWRQLKRLIWVSVLTSSAVLAIVAAGLVLAVYLKPDLLGIRGQTGLIYIVGLIAVLAGLGIFSAYLRAAHKIFSSQFYNQVLRTGLLCLGIGGGIILSVNLNAQSALLLTILAAGAALFCLLLHLSILIRRCAKADLPKGDAADLQAPNHGEAGQDKARNWLLLGGPIFLIAAVQQVMTQGNVILMGNLASGEAAGQYSIAFRIANFVPFALIALNSITAPMIASAYRRQDFNELQRIGAVNARLAVLAALAVSFVFIVFGRQILDLFGDKFQPAYGAMLVLLVGGIVNSATGSVGFFMTMTGRQNASLVLAVLALGVNIALAIILIPRMGLVGGAIAAASGIALFNLVQWAYVRKTLGVDTSVLGLAVKQVKLPNA